MEENNTTTIWYYVAAVAVGVIAAIGVGYFLNPTLFEDILNQVGLTSNSEERNMDLQNARDLAYQADFGAAEKAAREYLNEYEANTDPQHFEARSVLETTLFNSGDIAKRIEATKLLKTRYILADGFPESQAHVTNKLYNFLLAKDEQVFEEANTGEPFEKFIVDGEMVDALRESLDNLITHSLELFPTTFALQRKALREMLVIHESESAEEREAAAVSILDSIQQADVSFAQEGNDNLPHPFSASEDLQFHYWQGFLYGMVSLVDPTYIDDSEKALVEVFQVYQRATDSQGRRQEITENRLPFTLMRRAFFVHQVVGEPRNDDVISYLDQLIELVEDDPQVHRGGYLSFVKNVNLQGPREEDGYKGSIDYRTLKTLSEFSPDFEAFLERNGLVFEDEA